MIPNTEQPISIEEALSLADQVLEKAHLNATRMGWAIRKKAWEEVNTGKVISREMLALSRLKDPFQEEQGKRVCLSCRRPESGDKRRRSHHDQDCAWVLAKVSVAAIRRRSSSQVGSAMSA